MESHLLIAVREAAAEQGEGEGRVPEYPASSPRKLAAEQRPDVKVKAACQSIRGKLSTRLQREGGEGAP
eukprot:COSAG04_NODE_3365_length_2884_cov_1.853860_6_plen_68_part_01